MSLGSIPHEFEDFLVPGERNVRASLSAALDAVGLATVSAGRPSARDREIVGLPTAQRVCFVLVDGLGAENLAARSGHAPTLRAFAQGEPLSTVAPSTTAAAIAAIGTGELPGATGMLSYSLRCPTTGRPFSLIKWDGDADPLAWQTCPTLFERLGEAARECRVVHPSQFVGSGLTLAALRGAASIPAETLDQRVDAAIGALRGGTRAVYLYWGDVDHVGHARGWASQEWVAELEALDAGVRRLVAGLPSGTLLVVTADHGMVDVGERLDVREIPALAEGVELVAGEERAVHVYTPEPRAVATRWRGHLGERSLVMTRDEAFATGMFGPRVCPKFEGAVGDVLAFQTGGLSIVDSRRRRAGQSHMVGVHGSLTSREMLVPLLVEMV